MQPPLPPSTKTTISFFFFFFLLFSSGTMTNTHKLIITKLYAERSASSSMQHQSINQSIYLSINLSMLSILMHTHQALWIPHVISCFIQCRSISSVATWSWSSFMHAANLLNLLPLLLLLLHHANQSSSSSIAYFQCTYSPCTCVYIFFF